MRFASVCSGIEAASVAWRPLGWAPAWCSEIEPFCCSVLQQRHEGVPNLGDMLTIKATEIERCGPVDLLVGGTPCQSFSVAGLRGGLDDPRGNLSLRFFQLASVLRARWVVWENVPGVLSSHGGKDFGAILGALAELGYGFAYRVLDAQYIRVDSHAWAVPQRRRRVFVVGYLGDWRRAAAVLLERESMRGDPPPSRGEGQGTAAATSPSVRANGPGHSRVGDGRGQDPVVFVPTVSPSLKSRDAKGPSSDGDGDGAPLIAHSLKGEGHDASEDGTGRGVPLVFNWQAAGSRDMTCPGEIPTALQRHQTPAVLCRGVRRLTPRECERLQGFPDDYTLVQHRGKAAKDGPRYRAIGNSMAVNVMRWIGLRIQQAERIAEIHH